MIYHFRGEYGFLSNMCSCSITIGEDVYPSVENAYIRCKYGNTIHDECLTMQPGELKKFCKKLTPIDGWDNKKLQIMYKLLKQKFSKDPFKTKLLNTGTQNIVEGNYWNDTYWGVDLKQTPNIGENYLGRLLMEVRKEIKNF